MRLVFFGSGAFGLPTLAELVKSHDVACIVTQPDKPAGRGGKLTPTPIGAWAAQHVPSIPLLKPQSVNPVEIREQIRGFGAQAWVVIAFGQKLGKALLDGQFAVNLHASLLPRWRGAAPIHAAILAGDTVTGNSVITLADRMDAGLILGQSTREIGPEQTTGELHDLLAADGPALVERVLAQHASGTLSQTTQSEADVTIATKLAKHDGEIDFHAPADFLRRQVHALTPWPGVSAELRTSNAAPLVIKLLRVRCAKIPAEHASSTHAKPGAIIEVDRGLVVCGNQTALQLIQVQAAGKRAMAWPEFARGRTIPLGATLAPVGGGAEG